MDSTEQILFSALMELFLWNINILFQQNFFFQSGEAVGRRPKKIFGPAVAPQLLRPSAQGHAGDPEQPPSPVHEN